jgi:succinate dehydrogenase hydrophobic anchor subunit
VFGGGVERNSGIELLKVIGIFLIVLSHALNTLRAGSNSISYTDYVLAYNATATTNIQYLILVVLSYSGMIGNAIFFISTAWFLLDSKNFSTKKWFFMLVEIWVISIIILVFALIERHGDIGLNRIIKSIFPNIFGNAWYITCYLLFYPIHTTLNKIIKGMNQKQLLAAACALFLICYGIGWVQSSLFYISRPISWVAVYFVVAYAKMYLPNFANSKKANIILLITGIFAMIAVVLIIDVLGLKINFFSNKLLRLVQNHFNPLVIITTFAAFNLARMMTFKNSFINYISSLSLLVYIMHCNIILSSYYRPFIFIWIYETFGYSQVVFLMLATALAIFVGTTIVAFIYDKTLRRFVRKLSEVVHKVCSKIWDKFANWAIKCDTKSPTD